MQLFLTALTAILIVFVISSGGYFIGARYALFDEASLKVSSTLGGIELFYGLLIGLLSIVPLGSFFSILMSLFMPVFMVKAVKKQYEASTLTASVIYIFATIVKILVLVPLHLM